MAARRNGAARATHDVASHAPAVEQRLGQLHRDAGNQAVQRLLKPVGPPVQRGLLGDAAAWLGDRVGDLTDTRPDEARLDAQEELADFKSRSYKLTNHKPSTKLGLFDAAYNPGAGELDITVRIAFDMQNGNAFDPEWVGKVGLVDAAKWAFLKPDSFVWQGDEAANYKRNAIDEVRGVWNERFTFFSTKPYWETLPPVRVKINIVEAPKSGDESTRAHFVIRVRKWPTDANIEESITHPTTPTQHTGRFEESANDAGGIEEPDQKSFTRTTATRAKYGEASRDNPGTITFDQGRSEISAAQKSQLQTFGQTLGQPYMPPFPTTLTGHASAEGDEDKNMRLSEDRTRNVSNEIVSAGAKTQPTSVSVGEKDADPTPAWRRVDITIEPFEATQTTVVHEFGHIFGLGDEYPAADTATSRNVGDEVAHSDLAERLIPGQQPVVAHHNESVMSNGEVLEPHHYVTFLEALGEMTGTTDWDIRPATPSGPGDFPLPTPGGTRTA